MKLDTVKKGKPYIKNRSDNKQFSGSSKELPRKMSSGKIAPKKLFADQPNGTRLK